MLHVLKEANKHKPKAQAHRLGYHAVDDIDPARPCICYIYIYIYTIITTRILSVLVYEVMQEFTSSTVGLTLRLSCAVIVFAVVGLAVEQAPPRPSLSTPGS